MNNDAPKPPRELHLDFFSDYGVKANTIDQLGRWKHLAELGNAEATCHLALAYLDGNATYVDRAAALRLLARGRDKGHPFCCYKLAEEELLEDLQNGGVPTSQINRLRIAQLLHSCRTGLGEACIMMAYLIRKYPSLGQALPPENFRQAQQITQVFITTLKHAYAGQKGDSAEQVLKGLRFLGVAGSGRAYLLSGSIHESNGDLAEAMQAYRDGAYGPSLDLSCIDKLIKLTSGSEQDTHQQHKVRLIIRSNKPFHDAFELVALLNSGADFDGLAHRFCEICDGIVGHLGVQTALEWFDLVCWQDGQHRLPHYLEAGGTRVTNALKKLSAQLARHGIYYPSLALISCQLRDNEEQLKLKLGGEVERRASGKPAPIQKSNETPSPLELDMGVIHMMGTVFSSSVHGAETDGTTWFSLCNLLLPHRIVDRTPGYCFPNRSQRVGIFSGKIAEKRSGKAFLEPHFPGLMGNPAIVRWLDSGSAHLEQRVKEEVDSINRNLLFKQNENEFGRNYLPSSRLLSDLKDQDSHNTPPPWSFLRQGRWQNDFVAELSLHDLVTKCPIGPEWAVEWNKNEGMVHGAFEMMEGSEREPGFIEKWLGRDRCPHADVIQLAKDGRYAEAHELRFRYSTWVSTIWGEPPSHRLTKSYDENHMLSLIAREMVFRGDYVLAETLVAFLILTEEEPQGILHHLLGWIKFQLGKLDEALDVLNDCQPAYQTKGFHADDVNTDVLEYKLLIAELNIRAERLDWAESILARLADDFASEGRPSDNRVARLQGFLHEAKRRSRYNKNLSIGIPGDSPIFFDVIIRHSNMSRYRHYVEGL